MTYLTVRKVGTYFKNTGVSVRVDSRSEEETILSSSKAKKLQDLTVKQETVTTIASTLVSVWTLGMPKCSVISRLIEIIGTSWCENDVSFVLIWFTRGPIPQDTTIITSALATGGIDSLKVVLLLRNIQNN